MFTTLIVQPIFNLLVLIYNLIPGHNFGLAVILFTITVRLLLWPLVKKQLHQTKMMRKLQPELKRIKADAKGNRQKESLMMMELYKERGVKPLRSIGLILVQAPILIGLYIGLRKIIQDPHEIVSFSYPVIQHFSWMKELAADIHKFDESLFGLIDLTKPALSSHGIYWPAMLLVVGSATVQFLQSKQLLPQDEDKKTLRGIIKSAANEGKQADQADVSAAINRNMMYFIPAMVFLFTVQLACALSLYWLVGGIVAFIQQSIVLREDTEEMDKIADEPSVADNTQQREQRLKNAIEAEIVSEPTTSKPNASRPKTKKHKNKAKKRRR